MLRRKKCFSKLTPKCFRNDDRSWYRTNSDPDKENKKTCGYQEQLQQQLQHCQLTTILARFQELAYNCQRVLLLPFH